MVKIIDRDGLREKGIKYSRAQIDRKVKDGTFPKPVALGAARKGWVEAEIDDWLRSLIEQRDATMNNAATEPLGKKLTAAA